MQALVFQSLLFLRVKKHGLRLSSSAPSEVATLELCSSPARTPPTLPSPAQNAHTFKHTYVFVSVSLRLPLFPFSGGWVGGRKERRKVEVVVGGGQVENYNTYLWVFFVCCCLATPHRGYLQLIKSE